MNASSTISFVAVGDLYIHRPDPTTAFHHFASVIERADIAFGNLEGPCSDLGEPTIGKYITIGMGPEVVPALAEVGFDVVALANNHAVDYGRTAFVDTLDRLAEAGIETIGGGRTLAEAREPAILARQGMRLGILSYASTIPWGYEATESQAGIAPVHVRTLYEPRYQIMGEQPGTPATVITEINQADLERIVEEVRDLKSRTDMAIVSFHWGVAFVPDPVGYQPELARAVIDAGADLVLGHHAHVIQGVEWYRGVPIFYSLSNFVFDRHNPRFGLETFLVVAHFDQSGLKRVSLRPAILPLEGDPRPVSREEGALFMERMARLSCGMNSRFRWDGEEIEVLGSEEGEHE
ncbi:MAG: CapA family protein [Chloroflexota bacterium]|nr:CapA family protein [Chloroflexota bacterium]